MKIDDLIPSKGAEFVVVQELVSYPPVPGVLLRFAGEGSDPKSQEVWFSDMIRAEVPHKEILRWLALGYIKRLPSYWDHILSV